VLNLFSNAFKHTFEKRIDVGLQWCDDHFELAVADSCLGIPIESLPRFMRALPSCQGSEIPYGRGDRD
jgi:signal transduction histidine kinase